MKRSFLIAFLLLSVLFDRSMATDRTIPITFSVTSSGINRFLAGQWNAAGFTKTWSGSYQGLSYSIVLNRPVISLATNAIKITLSLTINATEGTTTIFNGAAAVTPTLTIPSTTISMDKIYSQYTDLHNAINAVIPDWRLQQKVEEALAPISWIMYQGKMLNESSTRLVETADISWKGLPTLTSSVTTDEINFTVTPTISSATPYYWFQWNRNPSTTFGLRVLSNTKFAITWWRGNIIDGSIFGSTSTESVATYDAAEGKYVATSYISNSDFSATYSGLYYRVKLKRGNSEMLFNMDSKATAYNNQTSWKWFPSNYVEVLRGE